MSALATLVPVEEYVLRSYEPDCEYVGGQLLERNVGEHHHARVQGLIIEYFAQLRERNGRLFRAWPEQRVRTRQGDDSERRYRVPDVIVMAAGYRRTPVIVEPALIIVEILSPDDSLSDTVRKCQEYTAMGTPHVWIVNPYKRIVYTVTLEGVGEHPGNVIAFACGANRMDVDFRKIFEEMDSD